MGCRARKRNSVSDNLIAQFQDCIQRGKKMLAEGYVNESDYRKWSTEVRQYIGMKFGEDSRREKEFDAFDSCFVPPMYDDPGWLDRNRQETLGKKIDWLEGIHASLPFSATFSGSGSETPVVAPDKITVTWLKDRVPVIWWWSAAGILAALLLFAFEIGMEVGKRPDVVTILQKLAQIAE